MASAEEINALLQGADVPTLKSGGVAQVNPLAAIQAGNQAAQAEFQTRGMQAQQALGNILQQSTDANGNVDYQRAHTMAAQAGPIVQMGMAKFSGENSQLRGQQIVQAAGVQSLTAHMMSSFMQDASDDALERARQKGMQSGMPASLLGEIDRLKALPEDQRKVEAWKAVTAQTDALHQLAGAGYGSPQLEDVGGRKVPVIQRPGTPWSPPGMMQGSGGLDTGLTPAQRAQPVEWTGQDGTPHKGTLEEMHREMGIGTPSGPAVGGQGGGGGAAQPPRTAASIKGPEPGMAEKWEASAKAYNAANAEAGTYQQRVFPLVQAHTILKSGDVTTGAGAEALNTVKSRLMTVATMLGVDAQTIAQADFDKTAKYLQQYVNQMGLSGRSDQAMASAVSGNPSAHISTLANQQILPVMIGMERMKQMIFIDFQKSGGKPNQFSDYQTNWQNTHDPRAFIFDMMDTPVREKMVKSMSPTQRQAFARTLDLVERNPGVMGQAAMPGH